MCVCDCPAARAHPSERCRAATDETKMEAVPPSLPAPHPTPQAPQAREVEGEARARVAGHNKVDRGAALECVCVCGPVVCR